MRRAAAAAAGGRGESEAGAKAVGEKGEVGAKRALDKRPLPPQLLVRRNSTSTIYLAAHDTLSDPDLDATIRCVCAVLRAHMVEAVSVTRQEAGGVCLTPPPRAGEGGGGGGGVSEKHMCYTVLLEKSVPNSTGPFHVLQVIVLNEWF